MFGPWWGHCDPVPRVWRQDGVGERQRPAHPVVIGERQARQAQPDRFFGEFVRSACPVEEAEVAVTVQLGIRDDGFFRWPDLLAGPVALAFARYRPVIVRLRQRPAGQFPFQLAPRATRVVPGH